MTPKPAIKEADETLARLKQRHQLDSAFKQAVVIYVVILAAICAGIVWFAVQMGGAR